jgi:hypothetical protein
MSIILVNKLEQGFGVDYDSIDQVYYILDELCGGKSKLADRLVNSIHKKNRVVDSLAKRIGYILLRACDSGEAKSMLDKYRQMAEEKLPPDQRPEFLTVDTIRYLGNFLSEAGIHDAFVST